jgi:Domain of unknown function (DUF2470)
MADQASKDAAAKQRIIKHMNNDHADSLSLYLQHYGKLPARSTRGAIMTDISLSAMTFRTTDGKAHIIPLKPPMTSFAEARTRSVDMDREARSALDISSIKLTSYLPPQQPVHVIIFSLCLMAYINFATKHKFVPGNWFHDNVLPWWPGGAESYLWAVNKVFYPMLAIHITEAVLLDRIKLRKYGVERGSLLWWKWIVSVFIEGWGSWKRIDEEVERKRMEAEKAQH